MDIKWIKSVTEKKLYLIMIISVAALIITNQIISQQLMSKVEAEEYAKFITGQLAEVSQRLETLSYKAAIDEGFMDDLREEVEAWNLQRQEVHKNDSSLHLSEADTEKVILYLDQLDATGDELYTLLESFETSEEIRDQISRIDVLEEEYSQKVTELYELLETISEQELRSLRTIEIIIAVISLILLWAEFQFIIRPFVHELKRRKDKLEKLNKSKDRILATVAHDIRNPITGIEGMLGILAEQLEKINPEDQELIDLSIKSCKKAQSLIQELLDISLIESEDYHLDTEVIHLEQYLKGVISQFRAKAEEKDIELKLKIDPESLKAEVDTKNFSRVIENIISNAIKFTEQGKVELYTKEKEDDVIIEIRDTGIGIPEKLKDYIFDKFSRARRLGTKGESTTGLGMSIVKSIVEKHGGRVWLESQEGKGTVFFITLPKHQE